MDSVAATAPRQAANHSRFIVDTVARLRDSAAALDARYQRERLLLDGESRALDTLNRHSGEYTRRFDDWRRRARAADSLRVARDRLRARFAP